MDFQGFVNIDTTILTWFNGSNSVLIDHIALTLTSVLTWIPLFLSLFYLLAKNNEKFVQILIILSACSVCLLLADGLADGIVKPLVQRLRPSANQSLRGIIHIVEDYRPSGYSFFSAHAANTCSLAVFFSLLIRHRVFTVFMVLWSLINCWTRLYLGVHFPTDILVGLLWGGMVGTFVYFMFTRAYSVVSHELHYISTQYTKTGYSLCDINVVLNVMTLTYIYAIIRAVVV